MRARLPAGVENLVQDATFIFPIEGAIDGLAALIDGCLTVAPLSARAGPFLWSVRWHKSNLLVELQP